MMNKAYDTYAYYFNRSGLEKKIKLGDLVFKKQSLAVGPLRKFQRNILWTISGH